MIPRERSWLRASEDPTGGASMTDSLRHVEPGIGGITRRVAGRGFSYIAANGKRISSEPFLKRVNALAIPPAWSDVWIARQANAHIQATGVDAAGRTQYLYHRRWREIRDGEKFIRSLAFAQRLPTIRRIVTRDLKQQEDSRRRALAAAVRLMDRAGLRVGGAAYAEENGSFGATTLQVRHVSLHNGVVTLKFRGKAESDWDVRIEDNLLRDYFVSVPHKPRSRPALGYFSVVGRSKQWQAVTDADVNSYLAVAAGPGFTAKDFRTWQGTAAAAIALAHSRKAGETSPEAVTAAIKVAAEWLHNTPSIAKESYVNPRVVALFEQGSVADLNHQKDRAVVTLLSGKADRK